MENSSNSWLSVNGWPTACQTVIKWPGSWHSTFNLKSDKIATVHGNYKEQQKNPLISRPSGWLPMVVTIRN